MASSARQPAPVEILRKVRPAPRGTSNGRHFALRNDKDIDSLRVQEVELPALESAAAAAAAAAPSGCRTALEHAQLVWSVQVGGRARLVRGEG